MPNLAEKFMPKWVTRGRERAVGYTRGASREDIAKGAGYADYNAYLRAKKAEADRIAREEAQRHADWVAEQKRIAAEKAARIEAARKEAARLARIKRDEQAAAERKIKFASFKHPSLERAGEITAAESVTQAFTRQGIYETPAYSRFEPSPELSDWEKFKSGIAPETVYLTRGGKEYFEVTDPIESAKQYGSGVLFGAVSVGEGFVQLFTDPIGTLKALPDAPAAMKKMGSQWQMGLAGAGAFPGTVGAVVATRYGVKWATPKIARGLGKVIPKKKIVVDITGARTTGFEKYMGETTSGHITHAGLQQTKFIAKVGQEGILRTTWKKIWGVADTKSLDLYDVSKRGGVRATDSTVAYSKYGKPVTDVKGAVGSRIVYKDAGGVGSLGNLRIYAQDVIKGIFETRIVKKVRGGFKPIGKGFGEFISEKTGQFKDITTSKIYSRGFGRVVGQPPKADIFIGEAAIKLLKDAPDVYKYSPTGTVVQKISASASALDKALVESGVTKIVKATTPADPLIPLNILDIPLKTAPAVAPLGIKEAKPSPAPPVVSEPAGNMLTGMATDVSVSVKKAPSAPPPMDLGLSKFKDFGKVKPTTVPEVSPLLADEDVGVVRVREPEVVEIAVSELKEELTPALKVKTDLALDLGIRPAQVLKSAAALKQEQRQVQRQMQKQMQKQMLKQKSVLGGAVVPFGTFGGVGFGGLFGRPIKSAKPTKQKAVKTLKQPRGYTPSLIAQEFGVFGKEMTGLLGGFEIRPVTSKKKRKRFLWFF